MTFSYIIPKISSESTLIFSVHGNKADHETGECLCFCYICISLYFVNQKLPALTVYCRCTAKLVDDLARNPKTGFVVWWLIRRCFNDDTDTKIYLSPFQLKKNVSAQFHDLSFILALSCNILL